MSTPPHKSDPLNPVRARLKEDRPCIGILVTMPSVPLTQTLAAAGFDWLFIDMEHGPLDIASVHAMIAATGGTRTAPFVRVPWNLPWLCKPVLDAGAMGVVFPMIRTAEEARRAVSAVRYPPAGERGYGPFYAPPRWGLTTAEYVAAADEEIVVMVLIEHREAIENVESILAVPGVDVAFIAPFDLALSYGKREGPDEEVQAAIAEAERAILASDAHLGGLALDADQANRMIERGYRMLAMGYDALLIERASADLLGGIRR